MSATNLLQPPSSSAFFAGAKTSKATHQSSSRKLNFSPIHPTPLHSLSSLNPLPISASASDGISRFASNVAMANRSRCGSRSLPSPLRAAGEPLSAAGEDGGDLTAAGGVHDFLVRAGEALSIAFPLWVSLACLVALWKPPSFLWVDRTWQIVGLTLTMLGMGMTLTLDDLRAALLMPRELAAGFVLQYTVMPLSGYFVSKFLKLPSYYAAGLILVGCCPGGTASNIVTFLARGNVALSVLMTAASTFAAAIMTPFLTSKLAGQFVAVDSAGLFVSTVQVVLFPVLLGAILNQYCNNLVKFVSPVMPFIAVATVAILCGSAIAQSASAILSSGLQVVIASIALHGSGFFFGYVLSKLLGIGDISARTISIEVGMQNSVLGVVLASQHFGNPLTAVPCAVSSICHSIYGSVLAGIWRSMPVETKVED
ncbi:probable sodium/metabolite cotransporter BASS1, chloroplastic isoform X2 [Dendrobium catenatum]|uniref:Putative sodium/metabolite cotransporter BASS1, chloroplastic n=1 Tax=Dendrobium catenatum TaxID=906689 RepID=A0A2I0W360_9ASPA|nr:probable sodium/metabolite cotransporter BASS1, chloroplastic isoform X2 [Dendrobium catenatum]PKU70096.1 putative sodium/metabolite cotransporter BASS1, chloroplastic [Dendrobium catenatum]